jgi:hypothetical protein
MSEDGYEDGAGKSRVESLASLSNYKLSAKFRSFVIEAEIILAGSLILTTQTH